MPRLPWIHPGDSDTPFPPLRYALDEPNGLLAAGGNLSPRRLLMAYRRGIFPWFGDDEPILWWSPDPRAVLFPEDLRISRSLRKTLRQGRFEHSMDQAFDAVILACAEPRRDTDETWITSDMMEAYARLHRLGWAHSVETWQGEQLVGGLYGVSVGRVFFGESMFSRVSDASKTALVYLVHTLAAWGYQMIDVQQDTDHMRTMGSRLIARERFVQYLERWGDPPIPAGEWPMRPQPDAVRRSRG